MADNTTQYGSDTIATDDVATLNGGASSGIKVQRIKVAYGDDGTSRDVSDNFPLPVRPVIDGSTDFSVNASASAVTILAANAARVTAGITNDSSAVLYLGCSTGTPSSTSYSVKMLAGDYFETPSGYAGIIKGIWAAATGAARGTEYTT